MGASILPIAIHRNKLYLLFGKENKYNDTPGWSDFGGGTEKGESFKKTAEREGMEELTGFLGMEKDIKKLMKRHGTFNVDFGDKRTYRIHMVPMSYDPRLSELYNNNHAFLERKLAPSLIKKSKIFEKDEIRWISEDDLPRMRSRFRSFYRVALDDILRQKNDIRKFARRALRKKGTKKKAPLTGTRSRARIRRRVAKITRKKGTGKKTRKGGNVHVQVNSPHDAMDALLELDFNHITEPSVSEDAAALFAELPDKLDGMFEDNPRLIERIQEMDNVRQLNRLSSKLFSIAEEYARLKGLGDDAIEHESWAREKNLPVTRVILDRINEIQ